MKGSDCVCFTEKIHLRLPLPAAIALLYLKWNPKAIKIKIQTETKVGKQWGETDKGHCQKTNTTLCFGGSCVVHLTMRHFLHHHMKTKIKEEADMQTSNALLLEQVIKKEKKKGGNSVISLYRNFWFFCYFTFS